METNCPTCGTRCEEGDLFCRKCGASLRSNSEIADPAAFENKLTALLGNLKDFRAWIDQKKRVNARFMLGYKERMEKDIRPSVKEFDLMYGDKEEGRSLLFLHTMKAYAALSRPVTFMETKLRPSVGMGVFLERWMMAQAVEDQLKECCQEADYHLQEIAKKLESTSGVVTRNG